MNFFCLKEEARVRLGMQKEERRVFCVGKRRVISVWGMDTLLLSWVFGCYAFTTSFASVCCCWLCFGEEV